MRRFLLVGVVLVAFASSASGQSLGGGSLGGGSLGAGALGAGALGGPPSGVAGPLDGPHYLHYDANDLNGNGDGNAGWTNLDVFTAPTVGTKNWIEVSGTATQDLTLGMGLGNPDYIASCSPNGGPCARMDGSDALKQTTGATGSWADFYTDKESMTCSVAVSVSDNNAIAGFYGNKGNGSVPGIMFCHDSRNAADDRLYTQWYTDGYASPLPAIGTAPLGFAVYTQRLDAGTDLITMFVDATAQTPTGNVASLSTSSTTQLNYLYMGYTPGFGYLIVDYYEILCWKSAKTDDQIAEIVTALTAKWE